MKIDELLWASGLLDFYGGMLTDKQRSIATSYLDYNASLAEIAEDNGITRQAVGDILRRTLKKLEEIEFNLGLYSKYQRVLGRVPEISKSLTNIEELQEKITHEFTQLFKSLED